LKRLVRVVALNVTGLKPGVNEKIDAAAPKRGVNENCERSEFARCRCAKGRCS
jgi:hypothetical protein